MSSHPEWITRLPLVKGLSADQQDRVVEIFRFCLVGGMNWIVDFAVFNLFRWFLPVHFVMAAKVAAVVVAATFSWVMNRTWTFQERATSRPGREFLSFLAINAIGMTPPLLCLWISHYLLGLTSALADNISANVIGLILGTILRYFGYRYLVFTKES